MAPSFTRENLTDIRPSDPVSGSYLSLLRAVLVELVYALNVFFCKRGVPMGLSSPNSKNPFCVYSVLLVRYVFKVTSSVISFIAVLVVYLKGGFTNKSKHDQLMNVEFALSFVGKRNLVVAVNSLKWFKDATSFTRCPVKHASNISRIRDVINGFIAGYWFPNGHFSLLKVV